MKGATMYDWIKLVIMDLAKGLVYKYVYSGGEREVGRAEAKMKNQNNMIHPL